MRISEPSKRFYADLCAMVGALACQQCTIRAGAPRLIRLIRFAGRISGGAQVKWVLDNLLEGVQGLRVQFADIVGSAGRERGARLFELCKLVRLPALLANSQFRQIRGQFGGWGIQVAEIVGNGWTISKFIFWNQIYGQTERDPLYATGTGVNGKRRAFDLQ